MASVALASVIQLIHRILPELTLQYAVQKMERLKKKMGEPVAKEEGDELPTRRTSTKSYSLSLDLPFNFPLCPKEKMISLHENLVFLKDFLQNPPESSGLTISDLEVRIQDVAYRMIAIIEPRIPKIDSTRDDQQQLHALQRCIDEVNSIVEEAKMMSDSSSVSTSSRRALFGKESLVGVNKDLIQIKERVVGDELNLQIIPITGMGGIGKTTLARNVYEDKLIIEHFDTRHWVTVSQEYRIHDILGRILSIEGPIEKNVELLIERVYKSFKGMRYLIVMDDMWHAEVWDKVRRAFPDDCNGSRVIVTTRLLDVASSIDSNSPLHQMRLLNEVESWVLLRRKVYYADEYPPIHMEEIGQSIAKNCRGLPLAIVVISGLLKANKTREDWENIAENVKVTSTMNDDRFSGIFSLSFNNLPHHLKACFLYMGFFPEDYKITVQKLIKLWVADDFLEPAEPKSLEELAEKCLEDLVNRNLILVVDKRYNGRIKSCKVHDIIRDLSIRKGGEEGFLQHFTNLDRNRYTLLKMVEGQGRLRIFTDDLHFTTTNIHNSFIHCLLYFGTKSLPPSSIASQFKSLRVLNELPVDPDMFPDEIFELVNLRYLAFTCYLGTECKISPSISKLQNLHTLIVRWEPIICLHHEVILPLEIWDIPELRHLVSGKYTLFCFPDQKGLGGTCSVLKHLQTLSGVLNFKSLKEAVNGFPNLKKFKLLHHSFKPEVWVEFCLDSLVYLQELEELNIELHDGSVDRNYTLLTNLAFPWRLRKLTLTGCRFPSHEMSVIGSLPNLEVLKLMRGSFVGEDWETKEGEFLALKYLHIEAANLVEWRVESSSHFPCLEKLIIQLCFSLNEVPSSVGDIPTLQILMTQYCWKAEDSVRRIRAEQRDNANDLLQVWIWPHLI